MTGSDELQATDRRGGMSGRIGRANPDWLFAAGAALFLLALGGTLVVQTGFDGLYGQDAFAYHDRAAELVASARDLRVPPPAFFPDGYPALVAVLSLAGMPIARAGQLTSMLAGAAAVLLTFLLTRDLLVQAGHDRQTAGRAGAVAAVVVAASGQMWQWSVAVMSDTTALALGLLAAWALVRYADVLRGARPGRPAGWLVLAAATLALAASTRYLYALLALPLAGYWLWATRGRRRAAARHLAGALLVGLAVAAPQLAHIARFPDPALGHSWLRDWSPLNAARSTFATPTGAESYDLPVAAFYAKAAFSPRSLFPLLTPLLVAGAWAVMRERLWPVAILAGGWLAAVYLFLAGIPFQNFRFALALLPPLGLLAALGLSWAWTGAARIGQPQRAAAARWGLVAATAAGLVGGVWYSAGVVTEFTAQKERDLEVVAWVERAVPEGARLVAFGLTATVDHYGDRDVAELFHLTDEEVAALPSDARPTYLLVDVADIEARWTGLAPGRHLDALRDAAALETLGGLHRYTLLRVVAPGDG